ncbi:MAG: hypothetical protein GWN61_13355 [candidate division Zixibacteria bacterium]|nr:hypothetical protein [candidate division Zixibacteria bacterium]NIS46941.1 hypothetical protein [candidate division Zixibacteria bacterium]NIU15088.1 hypothetical protein [candidate division Zixibacteria bacterium]NIV07134.1 hypothetical protein [candidate division Zixibacteria bacterium]NIW46261.1 hypothetical protein [Gammaproteobacteria bacterium]
MAEIRWNDEDQPEFHVHCHVSGGIVVGGAAWRYAIFQKHMQQVLQAFRYGDRVFFDANPPLQTAKVIIHFHSSNRRYNQVEYWGSLDDYRFRRIEYEKE